MSGLSDFEWPCGTGHDYRPLRTDYFKPTGKKTALGSVAYDQSVSYSTLFCSRCGKTLEVVASDQRPSDRAGGGE